MTYTVTVIAIVLFSFILLSTDRPTLSHARFTGRWATHDKEMVTINSGSYFEIEVKGSSVRLYFDIRGLTDLPQLTFQIDDNNPTYHSIASGRVTLTIPNDGQFHRIRVAVKAVNEHQRNWIHLEGAVKYVGITADGELRESPQPRKPLIEFLGDSITAGIHLHHQGTETDRMDGPLAYPSLVGQALHLPYVQDGFGRLGLLVTGNGEVPIAIQSLGYCFQGARWKTKPNLVVINLGTNDASQPDSKFQPAYVAYLQAVRKLYPHAMIICLEPFGGFHAGAIQAAVNVFRNDGDRRVEYIDTAGWLPKSDTTDGLHPSATGHRLIAEHLIPIIQSLLSKED